MAADAGALRSHSALLAIFVAREGRLLAQLGHKMAAAGERHSKEEQFDTWMKQESDLVQVRSPAGSVCLSVCNACRSVSGMGLSCSKLSSNSVRQRSV